MDLPCLLPPSRERVKETEEARPLLLHPSINVAVVFSGSSYQNEVKGRLSGENFVDLPIVVSPVTVLVNDTNPRDLLTRLCDTMAVEKLHGVVFEDDVGSGANAQVAEVAQILDFLSTQTALPIVGISGGSAVVIPHKVLDSDAQNDIIIIIIHDHHHP
ncbi:Glutamate receptor ionotropic, NMDA 2C [Liparis tanakae]|uniref:Glutamate receptor ionotropic, NMDA 2C n=1 Tax=Liparis tanakae TaxID=230148 RepID=A0A4Z2GJ23_9TELE|nr:Glutamate receptor ionotropic, NMDA 2C [Liparis tanakae]